MFKMSLYINMHIGIIPFGEMRQIMDRINLNRNDEQQLNRMQRQRQRNFIMSEITKTFLLVITSLLLMPYLSINSKNSLQTNVIHASPITYSSSSPLTPLIPTLYNKQLVSNSNLMMNQQQAYRQTGHYPQIVASPISPVSQSQPQQLQLTVCQLPPHMSSKTQCRPHQEQSFKRTAVAETQLALQVTSEETRSLLQSYINEFRAYFLDLVYVSKNKSLTLFNQATLTQSPLIYSMQLNGSELTRHLFESITNYLMFAKSTAASPSYHHHHHHHHQHHHRAHNQHQPQIDSTTTTNSQKYIDINHEINHYFRQMQLLTIQQSITTNYMMINDYDDQLHDGNDKISACLNESLSLNNLDSHISNLNNNNQEDHNHSSMATNHVMEIDMDLSINERLPAAMKQSLESAHTLLGALALSTEIFNNLTQHASSWMPHDSCHSALARMLVCPNCYNHHQHQHQSSISGATVGRPCENFCLNVLRGCMNDVYELDKFWTDHVMGIQRLKMNMIQTNNIENVFTTLDEKIHQMIRINSSPQVTKRILERARAKCVETTTRTRRAANVVGNTGHTVSLRSLIMSSSAPAVNGVPILVVQPVAAAQLAPLARGQLAALAQTSPLLSLFNRLDGFVHELQQTRGFFSSWPERICEHMGAVPSGTESASPSIVSSTTASNGPLQQQQHQQQQQQQDQYQRHQQQSNTSSCWNGHDYSMYKANLMPFGQLGTGNPEVQRPNEPFNALILNIIAKLKEVGSQLSRKNTRSPAASIYNDGPMGKYGHIGGMHHRNGLIINDFDHQQRHHKTSDKDKDSNSDSEGDAIDQDGAHHEPLIVSAAPHTNHQNNNNNNNLSDKSVHGSELDHQQAAESGQHDDAANNAANKGEEEEEEEEEVGDDVEGSGDYYTDDYPDDEQDDVLCEGEGEDCQDQSSGASKGLNQQLDQTTDDNRSKLSPWADHPQLPSLTPQTIDNNNNHFNNNDNQWNTNHIDRIQYNQPGFMVSHSNRYVEVASNGNNKQIASSANCHATGSFLLLIVMTMASSLSVLLSFANLPQKKLLIHL